MDTFQKILREKFEEINDRLGLVTVYIWYTVWNCFEPDTETLTNDTREPPGLGHVSGGGAPLTQ